MDPAEILELVQEKLRRERRNKLARYLPYAFQAAVHAAGRLYQQIILRAGNQVGKTKCGGMETAYHLTGRYPPDWKGRRWRGPVKAWASGTTNDKTRDILQAELCGDPKDPEAWGTGAIPGEALGDRNDPKRVYRKPGVPNAISGLSIKHVNGGYSVLAFKSYEMGKEAFMGEGMDFIWLDEEPPMDIYTQCLARILKRKGLMLLTFTPENGATELVNGFETELKPGQVMFTAGWDDAPHLDGLVEMPDGTMSRMRDQILAALPAHEREMRMRGIPMLGSGRIFPVPEEKITYEAFDLPSYFARIGGLDFGIDHPTAFVACAWDRDTDTFYVYDLYREGGPLISTHASAIKRKFQGPVSWPHDGNRRDSGATGGIAAEYRKEGVKMLPVHFTNPPSVGEKEGEGGISVEEGLMAMLQAMETGRFKVAKHLAPWFQEFRTYHRKEGMVVKLMDDLMSATRYAYQMRRYAKGTSTMKRQDTALTEDNPLEMQ